MKNYTGLKIILNIMLAVFAADFVAALYFLHSWFAAVMLAASLTGLYYLRPRRSVAPPTVGWDLGPAVELTNPDRPERVAKAVIAPKVLNLGLLMTGGPGSGKTIAMLAFLFSLRFHSPKSGWLLGEGKGDVDIYKMAVAMDCAPDHFFSSELPGSETINLFAGEASDVVDRLSKVLIGETTSTSFYSDEQRAVLTRVIPLLRCLPVATNLRDLYVALSNEDAGNELLRRAAEAGAEPVDLELARTWFAQPIKDRLKNISGLLNRLFIFVNGPYADRLNAYQPDIDIEAAISANESIYLHLPLTSFARDVAIAIIETVGVVARKRQLGGTENLTMYPQFYDDWGAFFHQGFGPYSARCRSAAMPLSFGFQSVAQLDAVNPHFRNELDDTIASKFILRAQGAETAEAAVTMLGEYEGFEVSTSDSASGERSTSGTGLQKRRKWRIEPRQLRELQPGEAYVSTFQSFDGEMKNPLWKLRVPMPPVDGWQNVQLPAARKHEEGEGLSLWSRYMNPAKLQEIHATLQSEMLAQEQAQVATDAKAREEAMAELARTPVVKLD